MKSIRAFSKSDFEETTDLSALGIHIMEAETNICSEATTYNVVATIAITEGRADVMLTVCNLGRGLDVRKVWRAAAAPVQAANCLFEDWQREQAADGHAISERARW